MRRPLAEEDPMICGIRGCDGDPVAYWEEPGGRRHYRCRLHQYELVPQHAVRHDYHLVPGDPAADQQAPAYRIVRETDG
jgi:hypothetical protein